MDYSNFGENNFGTTPSKKKDNGALGIVLIALLVFSVGVTIYLGYKAFMEADNDGNEVKEDTKNLLSDEDAVKIGTELYKKGYEVLFNERDDLSIDECKKAYDNAQKYFVKGAKINYTESYYRKEVDIKYGKLEDNYYDEIDETDDDQEEDDLKDLVIVEEGYEDEMDL